MWYILQVSESLLLHNFVNKNVKFERFIAMFSAKPCHISEVMIPQFISYSHVLGSQTNWSPFLHIFSVKFTLFPFAQEGGGEFTLFLRPKHCFVNFSLASVNFILFKENLHLPQYILKGFFSLRSDLFCKIEAFLVMFILSSAVTHFVRTLAFCR